MTGQMLYPPGQRVLRHYAEISDSLHQACENTLPFAHQSEPPRRRRSIKVCTGLQLKILGYKCEGRYNHRHYLYLYEVMLYKEYSTGRTYLVSVTVRSKCAGELKGL